MHTLANPYGGPGDDTNPHPQPSSPSAPPPLR